MRYSEYAKNPYYKNPLLMTKLKNMVGKDKYEFKLSNININGQKRGCSGFIKNPENGKIVYVDTERSVLSSLKEILIRTASSMTDYTGGTNHFIDRKDLKVTVEKMLR